jgi:hypothetical protein
VTKKEIEEQIKFIEKRRSSVDRVSGNGRGSSNGAAEGN